MLKSSDRCQRCGVGEYRVYKSGRAGGDKFQRQTLICKTCNHVPDEPTVLAEQYVRRRKESS
jgi:hypothetical protein